MSKENHSFSIDLACKVGINAAIIIQHLAHLHKVALGNGTNWKHGRYWINKTIRAFSIVYPYLTIKEIRGALEKLESEGHILSAKIAENHFDRTKWYSLEPDGFDLLGIEEDLRQIAPEAFAKRANGDEQKGKSDLSKRANENLPKGQMNTKVNYNSYKGSTLPPPAGSESGNNTEQLKNQAPAGIPENGYSFENFWTDYGYKEGSKKLARERWGRLTAKDIENIRATLEIYKRKTTTDRTGEFTKPMRKYPEVYLSKRAWEPLVEELAGRQEEAPTPFDEDYAKYLTWVQAEYEKAYRSAAHFTKSQFIEYKTKTPVEVIGKQSQFHFLKQAHEQEGEAYQNFTALLQQRLKSRQP